MKEFASLIKQLGTSTKTNEKLDALSYYFATADDADKVWVIALFSGRRPKRMISSGFLSLWCMEIASFLPGNEMAAGFAQPSSLL